MVCHAISMAITMVLPAPVASLSARRQQTWIRLLARVVQVLEESPTGRLWLGGYLGEPDDGLDRLDLTEERPDVAESVMPPVLEQSLRLGGDPPPVRVRLPAPFVNLATDAVDDFGVLCVLLLAGREALAFVEDQPLLFGLAATLLRLGDGRDELGAASALDDLLGRLAVVCRAPSGNPGTCTES